MFPLDRTSMRIILNGTCLNMNFVVGLIASFIEWISNKASKKNGNLKVQTNTYVLFLRKMKYFFLDLPFCIIWGYDCNFIPSLMNLTQYFGYTIFWVQFDD
jgi:hypothetical protein